ncbi:MAG: nuclear transport factor 2 family protein [Flavobacterium sp.]|nr:nuclear transport factor 2 family protein [Flavobacterium sp.]
MKKIIIYMLILLPFYGNAQNQEIENAVNTFFKGFHAKDTLKIKSVCHERMILQSVMEGQKGAKLFDEKTSEFYKSFTTFPVDMKFEEKILSYKVQIDGAMAHAWTPYEFYMNGKKSHSGVNAFTFFKENGQWKIVHLIDTRRKNAN